MVKKPLFSQVNRAVWENLLWFLACLVLAFFVWVIATSNLDPIQERRFLEVIPIQIEAPEGLLVTNSPTSTAFVIIRAQDSVFDVLTADDIVVWADLSGLGPGTHTVELQARVARRAVVVDTLPRQITATLEQQIARFVPVEVVVTNEPPAGFTDDPPVVDIPQVEISGAANRIESVVAAEIELDLSQRRNPFEGELRPTPVDAERDPINGITVEPQIVHVTVNVHQREDVREVRVSPNILVDTLPEGYLLASVIPEPQVVLVGGTPDQLEDIPAAFSTQPIDLTGRTADFQITVPVVLPDPDLILFAGQNVTVSVSITPQAISRQLDGIPVEVIGLAEGFRAEITPEVVSVLINGPQTVLESLSVRDIRVAVDLNGQGEGSYALEPLVSIREGQLPTESITVLPAEIDVQVRPTDS